MFKSKKSLFIAAIIFCAVGVLAVSGNVKAETPTFRIMTQSDSGDYIGQNKSWDFSSSNNSKITVSGATDSNVAFRAENFSISYMSFGFASETGKTLSPGLYTPAKRLPFRGSYNGIEVSGDGRGCNTILGAFYVHEYAISTSTGALEKAAIDFVQICEPGSSDINSNSRPKLYGSLRYNSTVPDSCDSQGCAEAKKNVGITEAEAPTFRIMTQSDSGDYIGQNKSWDFSNINNSKVSVTKSTDSQVFFNAQNFSISYMNFEFDTETGKTIAPGLYVPAKRYPFNDSYNGINISGDGRGCNTILGGFYVHEYSLNNDSLEKAAIDFVQICEPGSTELYSNTKPKLYGSLRYNSDIPDSCDAQGCATAKKNLGFPEAPAAVNKPDLVIRGVHLPSATDKRIVVEVKNAGSAATSYSKGIKVSASLINSNGALVALDNSGYQYLDNLPPSDFASATFNISGNMTSTMTLKVWIDNAENGGSGFIDESNENNNTLEKTITITGTDTAKPDLIIKSIANESTYKINVVLKNIGEANADLTNSLVRVLYGSNYYDKILNCDPDNVSCLTYNGARVDEYNAGIYAGAWGKTTLAPNEEYLMLFTLGTTIGKEVNFLPEKTYMIKAYADFNNGVAESNEDNNTLTATIEGTDNKPDLTAENFKYTPDDDINEPGTDDQIEFDIKNIGQVAPTGNFNVVVKNLINNEILFSSDYNGDYFVPYSYSAHVYVMNVLNKDLLINGKNTISIIIDTNNSITEANEQNNTLTETITKGVKYEKRKDDQIQTIQSRAKDLFDNKIEVLLGEIKELRNIVKEQQVQIKYLTSLKKDVKVLSEKVENAINNFIAYGVDDNTKKLGEGERAAVMHSFKAAFNKLPETEDELSDAIKIANGRWPSMTSEEAEKEAKKQFEKIYKHVADMDNAHDNAAITVMAYGLRQKAENRNLNSETQGIKIFKDIYGYVPSSTEDWNIMQAITYSGASRGADTDGDLLLDEREVELGTDPNNPDTDSDGYRDGQEVANGFDPLKK